jgi:hypothetical protein
LGFEFAGELFLLGNKSNFRLSVRRNSNSSTAIAARCCSTFCCSGDSLRGCESIAQSAPSLSPVGTRKGTPA